MTSAVISSVSRDWLVVRRTTWQLCAVLVVFSLAALVILPDHEIGLGTFSLLWANLAALIGAAVFGATLGIRDRGERCLMRRVPSGCMTGLLGRQILYVGLVVGLMAAGGLMALAMQQVIPSKLVKTQDWHTWGMYLIGALILGQWIMLAACWARNAALAIPLAIIVMALAAAPLLIPILGDQMGVPTYTVSRSQLPIALLGVIVAPTLTLLAVYGWGIRYEQSEWHTIRKSLPVLGLCLVPSFAWAGYQGLATQEIDPRGPGVSLHVQAISLDGRTAYVNLSRRQSGDAIVGSKYTTWRSFPVDLSSGEPKEELASKTEHYYPASGVPGTSSYVFRYDEANDTCHLLRTSDGEVVSEIEPSKRLGGSPEQRQVLQELAIIQMEDGRRYWVEQSRLMKEQDGIVSVAVERDPKYGFSPFPFKGGFARGRLGEGQAFPLEIFDPWKDRLVRCPTPETGVQFVAVREDWWLVREITEGGYLLWNPDTEETSPAMGIPEKAQMSGVLIDGTALVWSSTGPSHSRPAGNATARSLRVNPSTGEVQQLSTLDGDSRVRFSPWIPYSNSASSRFLAVGLATYDTQDGNGRQRLAGLDPTGVIHPCGPYMDSPWILDARHEDFILAVENDRRLVKCWYDSDRKDVLFPRPATH